MVCFNGKIIYFYGPSIPWRTVTNNQMVYLICFFPWIYCIQRMFSLCNITYAYICLELLKMFSVFRLTIPPFGKFTRNYCFSPSYANPKLFPGPSRSRLGDLPLVPGPVGNSEEFTSLPLCYGAAGKFTCCFCCLS
jgi:hypothetical protein